MCRRPLCPFLRFIKIYLMKRLTCPICRFSGSTGGEMNFHKCGRNGRFFCGNNSTLWISPPFGRLVSRLNFHIVWSEAAHGGKLYGGSGTSVLVLSFLSLSSFRPVGAPLRGITGRRPRSGRLGKCKRSLERRTVPDFFSATIDRCAIHKREHVLGYQDIEVRHF